VPPFTFTNLERVVPDAYHGTLAKNVESILKAGFRPSRGPENFLGTGVYFYESSESWADYWAEKRAREAGGLEPAILIAQIRLGRCINLSDREHCRILLSFEKGIRNRISSGAIAGDFRRITPAYIYNLAAQRSNADTIKKPYGPAEDPTDGWTGVDLSMKIVICVRQTSNITGVDVVRIGRPK
jgi:hypothetical protein